MDSMDAIREVANAEVERRKRAGTWRPDTERRITLDIRADRVREAQGDPQKYVALLEKVRERAAQALHRVVVADLHDAVIILD